MIAPELALLRLTFFLLFLLSCRYQLHHKFFFGLCFFLLLLFVSRIID
jgi:hypothetical protein